MKMLKSLIVLSVLLSSSVSMAKSPHDSDASHVNFEIGQGKILAAESNMLNNEIERLEKKLSEALSNIPFNVSRDEGRIVALISNQVENDLEALKKQVEDLSYETSSNSLHQKLKEIEKDIEMI